MPVYKTTVGNVELVSLTDSGAPKPPTDVFGNSRLQEWQADFPNLLDADGNIFLRFGSVGVYSGGKLVVVDTGVGPPDGKMMAEMQQRGVKREDVELVVTTHLHPDHVGWNLTDGRPTFPRARYLVPKSDYEYWTQPSVLDESPHIGQSVMPLGELDVMDLIDGEYKVTDELTTLATPGHTPGHISIAIVSSGQRGFILGDVAHSPAQAHYTDWNPGFDVDQELSPKTRHKILDRLEAEGALVSASHFPEPGFGRFVRREGRRYWQVL